MNTSIRSFKLVLLAILFCLFIISCRNSESKKDHCSDISQLDITSLAIPVLYDSTLSHPIFMDFDSIKWSRAGGFYRLTEMQIQNKASVSVNIYGGGHDSLEICTCQLEQDTLKLQIRSFINGTGGVYVYLNVSKDTAFATGHVSSDFRPVFHLPLDKGNIVLTGSPKNIGDTVLGEIELATPLHSRFDTCILDKLAGGFRCIVK